MRKIRRRHLDLLKSIEKNRLNSNLIEQLSKSSTSVGANYMEANEASSDRDFRNKICISRKESNESKHWLRMLAKTNLESKVRLRILWKEAHELTLIFSKIVRTCDAKKLKNKNFLKIQKLQN